MDKFFSQLQGKKESTYGSSTVTASKEAPAPGANKDDATSKQLPKGVVLGKDGKPCRSCTSTSAWFALMRQQDSSGQRASSISSKATQTSRSSSALSLSSSQTVSSSPEPPPQSLPDNCPPDVEALGRSTWTLLHSMSASYPANPTSQEKSDMSQFLSLFSKLYPCWVCAEDFQDWMKRDRPRLEGRGEFGQWMCRAHNEVNRKLGKQEFDCRLWEERWKDGWSDGSCG